MSSQARGILQDNGRYGGRKVCNKYALIRMKLQYGEFDLPMRRVTRACPGSFFCHGNRYIPLFVPFINIPMRLDYLFQ